MRITKSAIKQLLVGMSDIGFIGSPRNYPRLSSPPFADDKARMRSVVRKVDHAFSTVARRHIKAWEKNHQQVCDYRHSS